MKRLLAAILLASTIAARADTPSAKSISAQEAVRIAKQQLTTARPDLMVADRVSYGGDFVPAGPGSGGGPKWVIGFSTTERRSSKKWIYYVTVFPDGHTSKDEVHPGAQVGAVAD